MKPTLNMQFYKEAQIYLSKPVLVARYRPGMENGWAVCFAYKSYEGFQYFNNLEAAMRFYWEKPDQAYIISGETHVVKCDYYEPVPVLYSLCQDKRTESDYYYPGPGVFVNDESVDYEVGFLSEGIWIVTENDGSVRLWDENSTEAFFEEEPETNE